ncbi:MAG TPA: hypothetical protein VG941_02360 [Candidatus Paceibacterota bacterium]|nr:hypothetical protein [Candidatus Paceibacterota bacterium]
MAVRLRPYFSSIADLEPVFSAGLLINFFSEYKFLFGAAVDHLHRDAELKMFRGRTFKYEIRVWRIHDYEIKKLPLGFRQRHLDRVKFVLFHELTHCYHFSHGFHDYFSKRVKGRENCGEVQLVEKEIDDFVAEFLKSTPTAPEELVSRMIVHPRCTVHHECRQSSFYKFQKECVRSMLRQEQFQMAFSPEHTKLVAIAREMGISIL